ncbi:hypothetical protein EJ07DRAFT_180007 [Lizonia empirigonia]|nr:hypothetical protein EJ07DRAFT_180007 [Lizonia empirigonia]
MTALSADMYKQDRKILQKYMRESRLTLPLLLHTTQGIKATLAFITSTKIGTRKWHLNQHVEE